MLRELLDRFRYKHQGERALRDIFSSMPQAFSAIHMEEVGLPNGRSTTIQWILSDQSTISRSCVRGDRSRPLQWQTLKRSEFDFRQLMNTIRELDSAGTKTQESQVRDGEVYFVAWGDRGSVSSRTIRNPQVGSKSQQLVSAINASVVPHSTKRVGD